MEGVALLGILGFGYFLSNDNDKENVYNSDSTNYTSNDTLNYKQSKIVEGETASKRHDMAISGNKNIINNTLNMNNRNTKISNKADKYVESISGNVYSPDEFMQNEQGITFEPFFNRAPPSTNLQENSQLVSHQGGSHAFRAPRQEMGQLFNLEQNLGNVYGITFDGARANQERYASGDNRQNELPFQQEMVSHIDQKSLINQDVGIAYANRNSVDNTRTINNPKLSYEGKVLGGKQNIDRRGQEGEVYKHLPNQDYWQDADRWLVTTASVTGKSIRPDQVVKETNRQYLNEGKIGGAAPVSFTEHENRPMFKKSTNQQFEPDTQRNLTLENKSGDDNHNVKSYFAYPNERDKTTTRTHTSNLKSIYEAKTSGPMDSFKPTIKETTHTDYLGNASHPTTAPSSSDQYKRADLNTNKEEISKGRNPVTEYTKLTNGADTENIFIKKIETDYFNHHLSNRDKLYTTPPVKSKEEFTQEKDTLDNVTLSNRLDPTLLNPFKTNPYTKPLSSYAYT